jgi:dTDP-4-amino-4,6-dideoxygalactose transaminase
MIFTSISPNAEADDVWLAFNLASFPWRWKKSGPRSELEKTFSGYLSIPHTFAFESGRTSLFTLLSTLSLSASDEVLLQAYTCVAVPDPVLWAGCKPVYVDCLDDFTMDPKDLEKKITPKSKVLIIQHTFGQPAHIDELIAIAQARGLYVIEDCAHALGAEYKGKKVGTFGDASFFSFGRDKVISSVFGGMLAVKDAGIADRVRQKYEVYPEASVWWIKRQLNHPIIFHVGKKLYDVAGLGKLFLKVSGMLGFFSRAVEPVEREGGVPSFAFHKMPGVLAELALHQFAKLNRFNAHRREIATIYQKELAGFVRSVGQNSAIQLPKLAASGIGIFLRYTILVPSPQEVAHALKKEGIMLGDWYTEGIAPDHVNYKKIGYDAAACPNAESLAKRSLNLPTGIQTSKEDGYKVIVALKKSLEKVIEKI